MRAMPQGIVVVRCKDMDLKASVKRFAANNRKLGAMICVPAVAVKSTNAAADCTKQEHVERDPNATVVCVFLFRLVFMEAIRM